MASLVGKRRGGRTYYYLVESARVAGKPRIVAQQYLGSAEELAARLSQAGPGEPARTRHRAFGDLAAAWQVLRRLQVARVVDEQVGSRRADAAASVGTYLALAALNRVVAPRSKLAFAGWWQSTAGDRLVRLPAAALDHRRFWDAMDALPVKALRAAERAIAARMVEVFDLDLAGLVLDMTNFATFVDSANQRNTIAARGHAKQKRLDLRLVGLGLVVTADGGVPVLSHAYQGNRPDVTQFSAVIDELVVRFGALARASDTLTVVYDAGCDSADGQADVEASPLHFVGSLRPSDHPDLLAVARRRFQIVDAERFEGLTALETRAMALGADRRVILTHSEGFHLRQARGFEQTLAKARRRLATLQARLAVAAPAGHARRSRPRSPRSCGPAGSPGSSPGRWPARSRPACGCTGAPTRPPNASSPPSCSASASCSPTGRTGRWPRWWPPTAPKPMSRPASGSSKTQKSSPSAPYSTGPTRRSACTSSTACWRWPWRTCCAARPPRPACT
jgi:hypothetical protein